MWLHGYVLAVLLGAWQSGGASAALQPNCVGAADRSCSAGSAGQVLGHRTERLGPGADCQGLSSCRRGGCGGLCWQCCCELGSQVLFGPAVWVGRASSRRQCSTGGGSKDFGGLSKMGQRHMQDAVARESLLNKPSPLARLLQHPGHCTVLNLHTQPGIWHFRSVMTYLLLTW
jgi:hypothetical protein